MGLDAGFNCYSTYYVKNKLRKRLVGEYDFRNDHVLNDAMLMAERELHGSTSADDPIDVTEEVLDILEKEFIGIKEFCASDSEDMAEFGDNLEPCYDEDFDADFYLEMIEELRERLTRDQRILYWFSR